MSDLRYKSIPELQHEELQTQEYISKLKSQLTGQEERLKWIKKYLFEKTPQEMTIQQIEQKLGHAVILKRVNL